MNRLIIGLGNPGAQYTKTRHNIGKLCVERLAESLDAVFSYSKSQKASLAELSIGEGLVFICYPDQYMNVSGRAVRKLVEDYEINASEDLLIILDDVALPYGKIRLRAKGSSGGHNGLKSVDASLLTTDYARLRLGVGVEDESLPGQALQKLDVPLEDFVLGEFSKGEQEQLPAFLDCAARAARLWLENPIQKAVEKVNSAKW